jgi:hypothetical protein
VRVNTDDEVIELREDERKTSRMQSDQLRALLRPGAAVPGPSTIPVEPLEERPTSSIAPIRAGRRAMIRREAMPALGERSKKPATDIPATAPARPRRGRT